MLTFRDQVLLELGDPAQLGGVLLPAGDAEGQRVRTMLAASYDLSAARIDQVRSATVREVVPQHPLFPARRHRGSWVQTVPGHTRSELTLDAAGDPLWLDLLARLDVTVVTEVDPGGVESVVAGAVEDFTTLAEFRERVPFVDLDAFMAEHRISTVDELRQAFEYLVAEVHLRAAAPFDPDDPANQHTLAVTLAAVVVDPFDLAAGLRAGRLVRAAARDLVGANPTAVPLECTAPYAIAVVLPVAGVTAAGLASADVEALFAREAMVGLVLATTDTD